MREGVRERKRVRTNLPDVDDGAPFGFSIVNVREKRRVARNGSRTRAYSIIYNHSASKHPHAIKAIDVLRLMSTANVIRAYTISCGQTCAGGLHLTTFATVRAFVTVS